MVKEHALAFRACPNCGASLYPPSVGAATRVCLECNTHIMQTLIFRCRVITIVVPNSEGRGG
jgi:acetyl-CoA carboxylase beta subunit